MTKPMLLVIILVLVAGCSAQPEQANRVNESLTVGEIQVTLVIDPLKAGENRLVVTVKGAPTRSAEAHVIMTEMGHGKVVDLAQITPDRYEASTDAMEMEGAWMIRIKVTTTDHQEQTAVFHITVK